MPVDFHLANASLWLCTIMGFRKHITSDTNMRYPLNSVNYYDVPADTLTSPLPVGGWMNINFSLLHTVT